MIDKLIPEFKWKDIDPRIGNTILKKKNKGGRMILCDVKAYYIAQVIKTLLAEC